MKRILWEIAESFSCPHLQLLLHILQALDLLAVQFPPTIHRDVKPDSIIYTFRGKEYNFQLCDYGLGNDARKAKFFLLLLSPLLSQVAHGYSRL